MLLTVCVCGGEGGGQSGKSFGSWSWEPIGFFLRM